MMMNKRNAIAVAGCIFFASLAGCAFESIFTAGLKVANGQLNQLTANEILLLNQAFNDYLKSQNPDAPVNTLTQSQAEALAAFLALNEITTPESLQALIASAQGGGTIPGIEELAEAFAGSDVQFDPDSVTEEELNAIFAQALGGGN